MKTFLLIILSLTLIACGDKNKGHQRLAEAILVEGVVVERQPLQAERIVTGTLQAASSVRIFNEEQGRLVKLPFYEGDAVNKDDILAEIDASLIKSELNKAIATRKQASLDLKRLDRLVKRKLTSEEQLSRAKTALEQAQAEEELLRTRLGHTRLRAPFSGVISQRLLEPGDVAPVYSHILSLIDTRYLKADIAVSELLLANIKPGDSIKLRIDALGETYYPGKVKRIHPTIDAATRQGTLEIELNPVPEGALPGQLCRVIIETESTPRLSVPLHAVRYDNQGEYVFRIMPDNKIKFVRVRSGIQLGTRIEILEGLQSGEQVVAKGFLGLQDGKKIKLINAKSDTPDSSTGKPAQSGKGAS